MRLPALRTGTITGARSAESPASPRKVHATALTPSEILKGHAPCEARANMALRDRISAIMEEHGLTRREMAAGLDTPLDTLKGWLDQGKTPPAVLGPMLDLLEGKREVMRGWRRLGIK